MKKIDRLPSILKTIQNDASIFESQSAEIDRTRQLWIYQQNRMLCEIPDVLVEDNGETIRIGDLSPGCRACKDGKWDCIFLCFSCNLSCDFCLTPYCHDRANATVMSAFGNDLDTICEYHADSGVIGIGISGGEPLLDPKRLLFCISELRKRQPDAYIWAYTNGMLLSKQFFPCLAREGLDELRFNMAATGYADEHVTAMLRHAVTSLPAATVEIPAIPEHTKMLQKVLPVWSDMGVKYLNLHELIYERGSPSETMYGTREYCRMPDGHLCEFNPHSADLAIEVMKALESSGLKLAVNYCSLANKARQLRGRRRIMAPFSLEPYEELYNDCEAESLCLFDETHYEFVNPVAYHPNYHSAKYNAARVRRLLPLSPEGAGTWTYFKIVHEMGR